MLYVLVGLVAALVWRVWRVEMLLRAIQQRLSRIEMLEEARAAGVELPWDLRI